MQRKVIGLGVLAMLVALLAVGISIAQPQGGQRGNQRGGQRGMFDPARMQQMMQERMKEQLGISDDEWQVVGPRLTKVMTLSREVQMGPGMGRMFMGRNRPGGPQGGPQGAPGANNADRQRRPRGPFGQQQDTEMSKASEALQTTLENSASTADEIKAKLTAFRAAKEKARSELAAAQKELREVLTLRQEAQLVLMGMLN